MVRLRNVFGAAVFVGLVGLPAFAQSLPPMKTSVNDGEKAAVVYFVQDSIGDVQLGRLGRERAQNIAVRTVADALVRDHTKTAAAGLKVAKALGDEASLKAGDDNQMTLSRLARYRGAKFDQEYAKAVVDAHKTDIGIARDALDFAATPALRAYLTSTIAIDTRHLRMAQAAQQNLGAGD